uniref:protein-tyrosine-phosphatase n=1 Tax=Chelydra serpentina TaxID=8475 RepID=A0A8C3SDJ1_CHESE
MIEHVRLTQGGDPAPVCVHCSAGCGRTGVICILEHVRHLLLQQSIPPNFSIFDIVLAMRKQRPSAVQTLEQYEFLYHAVAEMFRSALATTKYENLKENQLPLYDDALSLRRPAPPSKRSSVLRSISVPSEPTPDLPPKMSDTYAVVNKFRRGGGPARSPSRETRPGGGSTEWSPIDPSGFGGLQASYSLPGSPVKHLPPSPSCEYTPNSTSAGDASPRAPPSPCPSAGHGKTPLHSLKPPVSPGQRPPARGGASVGGADSESGHQGSLPSSGGGGGGQGLTEINRGGTWMRNPVNRGCIAGRAETSPCGVVWGCSCPAPEVAASQHRPHCFLFPQPPAPRAMSLLTATRPWTAAPSPPRATVSAIISASGSQKDPVTPRPSGHGSRGPVG